MTATETMDYNNAIEAVKEGKKMTRQHTAWRQLEQHLEQRGDQVVLVFQNKLQPYKPAQSDKIAKDWHEVE